MRSIVILPLSLVAGLATGFAFFRGPSPLSRSEEAALGGTGTAADARAWPDSPGATDAKAQRLIAAALRKGSRMERQEELYLAIEALTADDLHRLVADFGALKAMAEKLDGMDWQTTGPLASGLIARWLVVDPGTVMTWAPRMLELVPKDQNARGLILDALAKKRPKETLELVAGRKDARERAEIISRALRELAIQDLPKARAWLEACSDPEDRRAAEKAVRAGTVQADPLRAIELAGSIKDRNEAAQLINAAAQRAAKIGIGTLRALATMPMEPWMTAQVSGVLAERDPELAVELALKSNAEPNASAQALRQGFSSLALRDPTAAIARMENLSGRQLGTAVSSIGMIWAMRDPVAALTWLSALTPEQRVNPDSWGGDSDTFLQVYVNWANREQGAARAWADALPAGATRDAVQTRLAQALAAQDQPAEAAKLLARLGSAADPKAFASVADAWAGRDPQAAADWALAQPPGPTQSRALASIVGRWANDNPQGVGDWLAQFPAGEARDRSVAAFLSRNSAWVGSDAERVGEFDAWFELIDDPWQRAQVAVQNFWARRTRDSAGARTWLASLPNVDPEIVRIFLRDTR